MTDRPITAEEKYRVVGEVIDHLRATDVPGSRAIDVLRAVAADLRAETPAEVGKVLEAMTFQVDMAKRGKGRLGYYEIGNMQTIAEGLLGRWWPVVERALKRFEQEVTT